MSERAKSLRRHIAEGLGDSWNGMPHDEADGMWVAHSVCEHLEIDWSDVESLRNRCSSTMFDAPAWCGCFECTQARKFATLLEAAGINP